jgi:hypothetical protein
LREALEKNRDLASTLEIFQTRRNGIPSEEVRRVMARVRADDVGYALIESKQGECEWYKDSQVINVQEECSAKWGECPQVNYGTIFGELKRSETQLTQCIAQYEERLRRVNEYMEQSNSSYLKAQEEVKALRVKQEGELNTRDYFLQKLITRSIELKN